jgi:hypothetical protein
MAYFYFAPTEPTPLKIVIVNAKFEDFDSLAVLVHFGFSTTAICFIFF